MAYEELQAVVGTAIVDAGFRDSLLSNPSSAVDAFDLSAEELHALRSIEANSLQSLASQLEVWMSKRSHAVSVGA